ncbi:MAG: hypothetical protein BWY38_01643 [Ignavibacteria bacterium ADurb.Bin266]|nr:MAG: hypothetical protein BWY38_01643 [Ignavibacteria bacterium ADurb.Bin266]
MGIEAKFTIKDVEKRYNAFLEQIVKAQIKRLQMLGEMCVSHARSIPASIGFMDQTGNLRSSIGYVVFVDGISVHSNYQQVKEGSVGVKTGEALAKKVAGNIKGICLVVTAGMNYALYVESKGRDVLTSAEKLAEKELPIMLEHLISNIKKVVE